MQTDASTSCGPTFWKATGITPPVTASVSCNCIGSSRHLHDLDLQQQPLFLVLVSTHNVDTLPSSNPSFTPEASITTAWPVELLLWKPEAETTILCQPKPYGPCRYNSRWRGLCITFSSCWANQMWCLLSPLMNDNLTFCTHLDKRADSDVFTPRSLDDSSIMLLLCLPHLLQQELQRWEQHRDNKHKVKMETDPDRLDGLMVSGNSYTQSSTVSETVFMGWI